MNRESRRLPDAELEVMQALWAQRAYPASSAELMEALEGRGNLYAPLVSRQDYLAAESRSFLERFHGGSLPSLVAALVESRTVTEQEIAELEEILKGRG